MLVGMLLLLVLFYALLWAVHAAREVNRQWRPTNTETGYQFPELSDISNMEVSGWIEEGGTVEQAKNFDALEESWADIIAALSPSAIDPQPAAWQGLGELRIQTTQGEDVWVELWSSEDAATGAFSAGPSFETAKYYRGGNTTQLRRALEEAYAEYLRIQDDELQQ